MAGSASKPDVEDRSASSQAAKDRRAVASRFMTPAPRTQGTPQADGARTPMQHRQNGVRAPTSGLPGTASKPGTARKAASGAMAAPGTARKGPTINSGDARPLSTPARTPLYGAKRDTLAAAVTKSGALVSGAAQRKTFSRIQSTNSRSSSLRESTDAAAAAADVAAGASSLRTPVRSASANAAALCGPDPAVGFKTPAARGQRQEGAGQAGGLRQGLGHQPKEAASKKGPLHRASSQAAMPAQQRAGRIGPSSRSLSAPTHAREPAREPAAKPQDLLEEPLPSVSEMPEPPTMTLEEIEASGLSDVDKVDVARALVAEWNVYLIQLEEYMDSSLRKQQGGVQEAVAECSRLEGECADLQAVHLIEEAKRLEQLSEEQLDVMLAAWEKKTAVYEEDIQSSIGQLKDLVDDVAALEVSVLSKFNQLEQLQSSEWLGVET